MKIKKNLSILLLFGLIVSNVSFVTNSKEASDNNLLSTLSKVKMANADDEGGNTHYFCNYGPFPGNFYTRYCGTCEFTRVDVQGPGTCFLY